MKLAIMQPYLFPYISYWQLVSVVDKFVIYDDVTFIKGGFINRNYILVQGTRSRFTLKIRNASSNKQIREARVGDNAHKVLKTIEQAYSKAKCFPVAFPLVREVLLNREERLVPFITHSLEKIVDYLEIDTEFVLASELERRPASRGQQRLLEICELLRCCEYVNPIGGRELYDPAAFYERGIELRFLQAEPVAYRQYGAAFVPWLSIVDVLMFNTAAEINPLLGSFKLV